jgi:DNA-binding NarL/FixJ family response regulator
VQSVGILEDNKTLRESIEDYVITSGKYFLAFSFGSFSELASKKNIAEPEFILLDIHLSDVLGTDIIANLKFLYPNSSVIVITGDKDKDILLKAIEKGACAYVYKPFKMTELSDVLTKVATTGSFLEPETLTTLLSMISGKNTKNTFLDKHVLTGREEEIFNLIKKGLTYKEMATTLNVSFHTINYHLKNIYIKTNVNSKTELLAKYFQETH